MKTLKLFNSVISKPLAEKPYISEDGYIIEPAAVWAKDEIIAYYTAEKLNGNDLNQTFHKSWEKIKNSTRFELLIEQIKHYISTYGSNFQDEIYIPDEILEVPDLKLKYKVIKAYSKEEMTAKCLKVLQSGIALNEETIDDLLTVMTNALDYTFTGNEGIRNKEAIVKIADLYGIVPTDIMEFFRYVIYRSTGQSLIIKSNEVIELIKNSDFNPAVQFEKFGLEKLAQIFNRFKPLFLAFKKQCPKTINRISKLSKKHHKPIPLNPLNSVTYRLLTKDDIHWLDNATPFALFKALQACHTRANATDNAFIYKIRNGKSWAKKGKINEAVIENHEFLQKYLVQRFDLSDKKIYLPEKIEFALPTSEKMFAGNIPTGTKFYGKKLAVGIYWKNDWGARDLDLSGLNIGGKIGWNANYKQGEGELMYSGDVTDAPDGGAEYLYANKGLSAPTLVQNNVYGGSINCEYKIIIGKGSNVSMKYMMNPNKLFAEIKCQSVQQQTILGMLMPEKNKQCFVLLNLGSGNVRVSGNSDISNIATAALYQQWNKPYTFKKLVKLLGAEIVNKPELADYDFSLDSLEKDNFIKIFDV